MNCTKCKKDKEVSEFRKRISLKRGYQSWCKECESEASKKRYVPRPKRERNVYDKKATLIRMLKFRYNLTYEEFATKYQRQDGRCAICNEPKPLGSVKGLNVDHCHTSGKIRGLLCRKCNTGIGQLNDDVKILENAIKYLNKNSSEDSSHYYNQRLSGYSNEELQDTIAKGRR